MDKIRYGIIGAGNQGDYYASLLVDSDIPDAVLTAICDHDPKKLTAARETYGESVTYFTEYGQMLDSGLCDVVLVEVPHYQHPEMVIACLEKGIHVITDKPAGVYTKQVRLMNEAAEKSGALFGMMFNQRTDCRYRKMK